MGRVEGQDLLDVKNNIHIFGARKFVVYVEASIGIYRKLKLKVHEQ